MAGQHFFVKRAIALLLLLATLPLVAAELSLPPAIAGEPFLLENSHENSFLRIYNENTTYRYNGASDVTLTIDKPGTYTIDAYHRGDRALLETKTLTVHPHPITVNNTVRAGEELTIQLQLTEGNTYDLRIEGRGKTLKPLDRVNETITLTLDQAGIYTIKLSDYTTVEHYEKRILVLPKKTIAEILNKFDLNITERGNDITIRGTGVNRAELKNLRNSQWVKRLEFKPSTGRFATDIIIVENATVDSGTVRLAKNGPIDHIARCDEFINDTCAEWVPTNISWVDYGTYIEFDVPHFSAYAGVGLTSVNTKKSVYRPEETAELIAVVLDGGGFLVRNADVNITITDPNGTNTTYTGTETSLGIYEANHSIAEEGEYGIHVQVAQPNVNMHSSFLVQENYEFDILRDTPVTTDPWKGPFESSIRVVSLVNETFFTFTESIPDNFTITDNGGGTLGFSDGRQTLSWTMTNNTIVSYSVQPPLVTPDLYTLGPAKVDYGTENFVEKRPWYVAIDPLNVTFNDSFEDNVQFTLWTETGEGDWRTTDGSRANENPGCASGTYCAVVDNCDSNCYLTMNNPINLTRYDNANLTFYRWLDNQADPGEFLVVQIWNDTGWLTIFNWTDIGDDTWTLETWDIGANNAMNDNFSVRFWAGSPGTMAGNEDYLIDDINITAEFTVAGNEIVAWTDNLVANTSSLAVGQDILFSANGTDADGDNYRLTVCDSNEITNTYPGICLGNTLCTSASTASGAEASCVNTTTHELQPNTTAYGFLCDLGSLACNTSTTWFFNITGNQKITFTSSFAVNDSVANTRQPLNYTATGTDPDGDDYRLTVCDSNGITEAYPGTCTGNTLCTSPVTTSGSQASCVNVTTVEMTGSLTAYGFLCDQNGLCTSAETADTTINFEPAVDSLVWLSFEDQIEWTNFTESGETDWRITNGIGDPQENPGCSYGTYCAVVDDCDSSCFLTMDHIDLSLYSSAELSFDRWLDNNHDVDEFLVVQIYNDSQWVTIRNWTDNGDPDAWVSEYYNLTANNALDSNFSIRFWAGSPNTHGGGEEYMIDGLNISVGPLANTQPTWTNNLVVNTSTVTTGETVRFNATATDLDSDNYRLTICDSDSITDGYPGVCGGNTICTSGVTSSGAEASCTNVTVAAMEGTATYFGFICDEGTSTCAASTSTSLTVNAEPGTLNVNINNPANGLAVNINQTFTINATVTCEGNPGAQCGTIEATARYNGTAVNTTEGSSPMYIAGGGGNTLCYQEDFQTATGCGGLATGNVADGGFWFNPANLHDDNYSSSGNRFGAGDGTSFMWINYTRPTGALIQSSIIQHKIGGNSITNFTMSTCEEASTLQLRIRSQSLSFGSSLFVYLECFNGTDWADISSDSGSSSFWEEAVFWNLSGGVAENPQTQTLNEGESWNVSWTINFTDTGPGNKTYAMDVLFNSTTFASITANDTADRVVYNFTAPPRLEVSITNPADGLGININSTFTINATVTCTGTSTCGLVEAIARYNETTINNQDGVTPMYITDTGAPTYCYQESANTSTVCGGIGNGTYADNNGFTTPENLSDEDYSTFSSPNVSSSYFYINYTIPTNADVDGTIWQIKDSGDTINLTLNTTCSTEGNKIRLRIYSSIITIFNTTYRCHDGTGFVLLQERPAGLDIFEEAILWNIQNPQTQTLGAGESWNVSWEVNFTGDSQDNNETYLIDALFNSTTVSQIIANDTTNRIVFNNSGVENGAGPPVISNVTSISPVTPLVNQNVTVFLNFTATDPQGRGDLDNNSAAFTATNNSVTRTGACSPNTLNSTHNYYNCSVQLTHYDTAGIWDVNVSISDGTQTTSNDTTQFTYNTLTSISVTPSTFNFGSIAPGVTSAGASNPVVIDNQGNQNITGINVTAYALVNTSSFIGAGNFTVNTIDALGTILVNNTEINVAGAAVVVDTDATETNEQLYFYLTAPSNILPLTYNSQANWVITGYE